MHENLLESAALALHRVHERRGLHEIRACTYDVQNFHGSPLNAIGTRMRATAYSIIF
jgi:hypothetical protein